MYFGGVSLILISFWSNRYLQKLIMDDRCFFDCTHDSLKLINCGVGRVETVRNCSIKRGDGFVNKLDGVDSIRCHKNCVSTYTSAQHVKRFLSKQKGDNLGTEEVIAPQKSRRSGSTEFIFKEHCLFCGEICITLASCSRHPDRWRKVIQCRTADDFKQNILHTCDVRNDCQAEEVRVRVSGAVSDLHAADGQYHDDCYKQFMNHKNVQAASNTATNFPKPDDSAFDALIEDISVNKSHVWNSLEIQDTYANHGGMLLPRRKLIDRLVSHFGDDLLVLSGNGVASIVVFRSKAPHMLKLVDDNTDVDVKPIAKTIKKECSERSADRDMYKTRLSPEDATEACSDQLLKLLAEL